MDRGGGEAIRGRLQHLGLLVDSGISLRVLEGDVRGAILQSHFSLVGDGITLQPSSWFLPADGLEPRLEPVPRLPCADGGELALSEVAGWLGAGQALVARADGLYLARRGD